MLKFREIYAQALEAEGFEVSRNFSIGQRDAYIPALEAGEVDVFPEYTGNLLQFYDPDTERSEERRVGKECRSRCLSYTSKRNEVNEYSDLLWISSAQRPGQRV